MMTRKANRICQCGSNDVVRYIYPLPGGDPWTGSLMCSGCAKEAIAELKRLGHFTSTNGRYPIEKAKEKQGVE